MQQYLEGIDWDVEFEGKSFAVCYTLLLDMLGQLIDRYVPVKVFSNSDLYWMCSPPNSMMRERSRAWLL